MDDKALRQRFAHHPPTSPRVAGTHDEIRVRCMNLASYLNDVLVDGRTKSLALTAIDEACMFANASVARTQLDSVRSDA